jgi:flavin-dependent dehydrogenase
MQAYVTPLAAEETCVVLISRNPRMRFPEAWNAFPKLAERLAKAELSSVERGAVTATCKLPRVYSGNVALTGDASGNVDAVTGEGLGQSFRQAIALADALEAGDLEKYQSAHRRLARPPNTMARLLLLLDRYPPLRTRVLRGMAKDPDIFSRMLAVHAEEASPALLAGTSARLGWQLLTA